MERLSDIFNNIKDRFTNPLIFSFTVSWTIINWRIVVALVWYDNIQIKNEGYTSIYSFIQSELNHFDTIVYPIIFALGYTFLAPVVRNLVRAFYSWTSKWGNNWNIEITKGGKVGIENYLKLRDNYDKRTKALEEVISSESVTRGEFESLKTENLKTQSENIELKNKESELRKFISDQSDNRILNGYWLTKFTDGAYSGENEVFIDNGRISFVKPFGDKEEMFYLSNFRFDPVNKSVFFIKENVNAKVKDETKKVIVNELRFERDDFMTGLENRTVRIEYRKK